MDTEPTQFTLEGNEVVHIANMDTAAAVAHANSADKAGDAHGQHLGAVDIHDSHLDHSMLEEEQGAQEERPDWHSFFFQLQAHKASFGTLHVDPQSHPGLSAWIEEQRRLYKLWKEEEKEVISQERIVLLEALGFDFDGVKESEYPSVQDEGAAGSAQDKDSFHVRLAQLGAYKAVHGHPNVPESYKEDPQLGKWVATQRAQFRKQNLTQDKIDALTEIGFDFTPGDKKVPFGVRLEQLKEYKEIHGDANVPRKFAENPG